LESIWFCNSVTGVSMKSVGYELPAQHQTISGGAPLLKAVASEMTRTDSEGEVRSALI